MSAVHPRSEIDGAESADPRIGVALRSLRSLDLTSLSDGRDDDIVDLCQKAVTPYGSVAAVCSWPEQSRTMARLLDRTPPRIAAVVNFPGGESDPMSAVEEAQRASEAGAEELDLVWPYRAWLEGERDAALRVVGAVRAAEPECTLKVILETGAFGEDASAIAEAGAAVIEAGADFLKTSTGKISQGATPLAARALLEAIAASERRVGFKVSGGVRDLDDASVYLGLTDEIMGDDWARPATFRIGASRLLVDLLATLQGSAPTLDDPAQGDAY